MSEHDPMVQRAIDSLRELPPTDRSTVDRVVAAAAAARLSPIEDIPLLSPPRRGMNSWLVGAIAAAAAIAGFMLRGAVTHPGADVVASRPVPQVALHEAAAASAELKVMPIPQQFVFNSRAAHRVSVVGDFNGWNADSARMTRSPDGDMWSATVPIVPGRHIFGFMVDDSIFVLDPRAPKVRDADLGTEGSVVIVRP